MKKVLLTLALMSSPIATADSVDEIIQVLKFVESNYNEDALGDYNENGIPESYGILQIQKAAIEDVNRRYGTSYTHEDAFHEGCAEEIFRLYIKMWTEHLNKKEGRKATPEDIVRIWNGGPRGYKRKSTIPYLAKYNKNRYFYKIMGVQKCIVGGKLGMVVNRYTHTMDVYLFKTKTTMYGVSRRKIKILPSETKKVTNQLTFNYEA